jgi:glycosyltransferase involved in cell wall biosynthesis
MIKWFRQNTDHEIHLITLSDIELEGVNIHKLKKQSGNIIINFIQKIIEVRRLMRDIDPDILHLHTLDYPAILGIFCFFRPLFITPWNGDVAWSHPRRIIHKILVSIGLKWASCITTDSEHMSNICAKRYGISTDRIIQIQWSGVDTNIFNESAGTGELRRKLGLSDDDHVVLSPRSVASVYNLDVLIDAIKLLSEEHNDIKYVFIWNYCDEKILSELKQKAERSNIMPLIRFAGKIKHEDLPQYFNMADAYISCSSYDTTPTSLLEAMACGCAPIVTDIPAVTEWVSDGFNGFVINKKDPISTAEGIERAYYCDFSEAEKYNKNLVKIADYEKNMLALKELYEQFAKS